MLVDRRLHLETLPRFEHVAPRRLRTFSAFEAALDPVDLLHAVGIQHHDLTRPCPKRLLLKGTDMSLVPNCQVRFASYQKGWFQKHQTKPPKILAREADLQRFGGAEGVQPNIRGRGQLSNY